MKVGPGEVVADKELPASLLETTFQPREGRRDKLSHQLSHQLQLLLLVSLEHGRDPLVDDIIDGVDYLVRLSSLQVAVAGQTVFLCQEPAGQKKGEVTGGVGWFLPRYGHGGADHLALELDGGQLTIGQPWLHLVELLGRESLVNVPDTCMCQDQPGCLCPPSSIEIRQFDVRHREQRGITKNFYLSRSML